MAISIKPKGFMHFRLGKLLNLIGKKEEALNA